MSGQNFSNLYNSEGVKSQKGLKLRFADSLVVIDVNYFMKNRQEINGSSDLIIEMVAFKEDGTEECVLATFCKLVEERIENQLVIKAKVDSQKLKVNEF